MQAKHFSFSAFEEKLSYTTTQSSYSSMRFVFKVAKIQLQSRRFTSQIASRLLRPQSKQSMFVCFQV